MELHLKRMHGENVCPFKVVHFGRPLLTPAHSSGMGEGGGEGRERGQERGDARNFHTYSE